VLLSLAMASASGSRIAEPQARQASDITVWLMNDAQSNWPEAVAAANQAFAQKHPGVNVKVQYQQWGDYKTKFEATLAAGNGPDVIEFGNTDTPKYTAAGALAQLDKADFPNSGTWLSGLAKAGVYNGKTFGVPYYAGARGVIYRTDQYKAAGIKSTPKSLASSRPGQADGEVRQEGCVLGSSRPLLVRRDVLRLRLRRPDRQDEGRQVGRYARFAAGARGSRRLADDCPQALAGEQDR
jgi:hypothetical protein